MLEDISAAITMSCKSLRYPPKPAREFFNRHARHVRVGEWAQRCGAERCHKSMQTPSCRRHFLFAFISVWLVSPLLAQRAKVDASAVTAMYRVLVAMKG